MERNHLDKIIKNHKSKEDLMSLQEVGALISSKTTGQGSSSTIKGLWLGVSIIVISTLGLVLWDSSKTNIPILEVSNTNLSEPMIKKSIAITKEDNSQNYKPIRETIEKSTTKLIRRTTPYLPKKTKSITNIKYEAAANTIMLPIENITESTSVSIDTNRKGIGVSKVTNTHFKSRFIYLTNKELEKFNIYLYDDVILYSNGTQKNHYELMLTNRHGSRSIRSRQENDDDPSLITSQINIKSRIEKKKDFKEEEHLALYVPINGERIDYYIYWFKKNDKNYGKLPERYSKNNLPPSPTLLEISKDSIDIHKMNARKEDWKKNYVKPKLTKPYIKSQIVFADNRLLKKLHIKVNENSIKYKKINGIGKFMSYKKEKGMTNILNSYPYSTKKKNNTPPSFITSQRLPYGGLGISDIASTNQRKKDSRQYFYANKNSMIAVKVTEKDSEEVIFWYENTKRLFSLLPQKDATGFKEVLAINESLKAPIAESKENNRIMLYDKMMEFKNLKPLVLNPIKLDSSNLKKLNIQVKKGVTSYTMKHPNGYSMIYNFNSKYSTTDIIKQENNKKEKTTLVPKYISDKYGSGHRLKIDDDSLTNNNLERLIPILVETGEEYRLKNYINGYFHPDCIFWYEPTPEFLNTLSPETREQLTFELSLIEKEVSIVKPFNYNSDSSVKSCIYLDPCANIKIKLKDFVVYPNPSSGLVNIKTSSSETLAGTITINNLAGKKMFIKVYSEIKEVTPIDISNLPSGIYLITLSTTGGDKITKRVIKK